MSDSLELPGKLTPVSITFPDDMEFDAWARAGEIIGMLGNASGWYIGGWLKFGEHKFGEKYSQAAELTNYDPSTLKGFQYVYDRVPVENRRAALTFAHHREVAPLEPKEQTTWLRLAEEKGWTRGQLRSAMRNKGEVKETTESLEFYYRITLEWPENPGDIVMEAITELCDVYDGKVQKIKERKQEGKEDVTGEDEAVE